jgi:hypothetical protein
MVLAGNKKYIALAAVSLAAYAILRGERAGLIIVASWRSNIASFRSERARYLIINGSTGAS